MRCYRSIVALLMLIAAGAAVYAFAAGEKPSVVRVGVYDNRPKIYRDTDGTIRGFWADITDAIAQEEGFSVQYIYDTWDANLARLASGQIDMMVDVAVSDQRSQLYAFNDETVLLSWGMFYTREGVTLESFSDLQGKRIAALTSGILYEGPLGLRDILTFSGVQAEIISVTEYDDVFEMLDRGEADVAVVSWFYGFANERNHNVRRTGILFRPSELRFAFPRDAALNSYLIPTIDRYVTALRNDPDSVYHESIKKNFGGLIETRTVLPPWVRYALFALGGVLAIVVANTLYLRRYRGILERRVAQGAKQLGIMYDSVVDVIFYAAVEAPGVYRFTQVNDAFARVTGLPMDAIVGKLATDVIAKESQALVFGNYERAIREKKRVQWHEISDYPNGRKFGEVSVTPVFDDGRCIALIGTVHDVTEKKRQEQMLRTAADKIAELQGAKNMFVSIAAHQLKTPVSVVLGSLSILEDAVTPELRQEAIDGITKGVSEMNELINFLVKITRAESGSMRLSLEPLDLKEVTADAIGVLSDSLKAKNQRVEIEQLPSDFPQVLLDREIAKQVILNLLSNANRYGNSDSVIRVSMSAQREGVSFSVTNQGIGIPESVQGRIFEKFFRAENARASIADGTGLGLALAQSFVQAWGGTIRFESEENKSTTFTFTVPTTPA